MIENRWTKIGESSKWRCSLYQCSCGTISTLNNSAVKNNKTRSCGCLRKEGKWPVKRSAHSNPDPLVRKAYRTWVNIRTRCKTKSPEMFKKYGSRGISVCERWEESLQNFMDDMGLPPSLDHSIDRIDNNGNYTPENCRWATTCIQSRNKRNTRYIEINGITKTLAEWMEHYGVNFGTVYDRLLRGWPAKEAFETPVLTEYKRTKGSRAFM